MTSWFRSWHGAPTDSKWLVIAKRANVAPGMVSAVFWALLDTASQAEERGSVMGFDPEAYALWAGWEETDVQAVIVAMKAKGVIGADDRLTAWDKRQPKREDDSSDRVRQHRERQKAQQNAPSDDVTQCNAMKRTETHVTHTDTDTDTEEYLPADAGTAPHSKRKAKDPTAQQEYFGAVCICVGWDSKTITKTQSGQVAQTVGVLQKAGYALDDLRAFYRYWHNEDWRGKQGQYPTLSQLRAEIGKVKAIPMGDMAGSNGGGYTMPKFAGSER